MTTSPHVETRATQRDALIMAALPHVPFDGWSDKCLRHAGEIAGLGADAAVRLFPDGARGAVAHFMNLADRLMIEDLRAYDLASLKVRERIAKAVRVRLERWTPHREAVRRALALVPLPTMTGAALRGWYRTVDVIWRVAGDRAVDFSFYTKRMLLAGVYGTTLLYWLDDRTENAEATWAFLDRRIADVMRIPKVRERMSKQFAALPRPMDVLRGFAPRAGRGWRTAGPRR